MFSSVAAANVVTAVKVISMNMGHPCSRAVWSADVALGGRAACGQRP